jgi:hypothetical protein
VAVVAVSGDTHTEGDKHTSGVSVTHKDLPSALSKAVSCDARHALCPPPQSVPVAVPLNLRAAATGLKRWRVYLLMRVCMRVYVVYVLMRVCMGVHVYVGGGGKQI